jgi:molecular chaperone GrpE
MKDEDITHVPIEKGDMEPEVLLDDVSFEESTEEGEALSAANKVKALQAQIKELQKEKQEYLDGWQRARADYANLQKTSDEDKKRFKTVFAEKFVEDLIPVVDSFSMAMANKESWEKVDASWRTGVEYIYNQLMGTLELHGLKLYGEVGEKFDPTIHEGVSEEITDDDLKDHTLAKIHQKGFLLGDSVLRPARASVYTLEKE